MTYSNLFKRYRENEQGTLTVEAVIVLPVLVVMFLAMFVLFDFFRAHSTAAKTAYTLGDMISRETHFITPEYMDGAMELVDLMTLSSSDDGLRVSVISYDEDADLLELRWSQTRGTGMAPHNSDSINALRNQIPDMPNGLQMIIVETRSAYDPAFDIGLVNREVETFVTTVPRFAPQLLWRG